MLRGRAPATGVRPALGLLLVLVALVPACSRDAGEPDRVAPETRAPTPDSRPVANRWEPVAEFEGEGDLETGSFDIAPGALQWRVTAECEGTALEVKLPGASGSLARPECPGRAFGFSIESGTHTLRVEAGGPWVVKVDQQLDTALSEPPLGGMDRKTPVARGDFYDVDQTGEGEAALYRLPDGRLALRFDPFRVTNNSDLFVWVSRDPEPRTSEQALASEHVSIARLKATGGAQNYVLPAGLSEEEVRSVVIWCEPVRVAYAAATLAAP
ncbi:MAG TPA: DM13 domain-containing protein [Actinomycetota bacterium]|nr:DM13 domain-containing protein [Actinomycetota bacterium]